MTMIKRVDQWRKALLPLIAQVHHAEFLFRYHVFGARQLGLITQNLRHRFDQTFQLPLAKGQSLIVLR